MRPVSLADAKVLLAAAPRPYKGHAIPSTVHEIEAVSSSIPSSVILPLPPSDDVLLNPNGGITVQTALDHLPATAILHLACHGIQNADNPLESGFILRDNKLSILQLLREPLPRASLAILSACETAKGSDMQPDQSVHLAAALLFSGFKSVFATMWYVLKTIALSGILKIYLQVYG